jgi:ureidoglycolate lyase
MPDTSRERHYLSLEDATPAAVAPFGWMLASRADIQARPLNFYPGELRAPTGFVSDDQTEMTIVRLKRRPLEVTYLERHFKHTQTFVPLAGKPFVMVLAPPCEGELPPLESLRAFRFDGAAGFCMKLGCWHEFPFVLEDDTDMVIVLRKETYKNLQNVVGDEAYGEDLDKKNLRRRSGLVVTVRA